MKTAIIGSFLALFALSAQANTASPMGADPHKLGIVSVEITDITALDPSYSTPLDLNVSCDDKSSSSLGEFSLGDIVNIGKQIWEIIVANKPVVNVETTVAYAMPRGVHCWDDLTNWQVPNSRTYRASYKNGFGMEVVKFDFRLQYTYGGSFNGKGRYIANATVLPGELNVVWGYTFNASVNVAQVVNMGSKEDPMAGMEISLKWRVNTPMKDGTNTVSFFVQGDGAMKQLQ